MLKVNALVILFTIILPCVQNSWHFYPELRFIFQFSKCNPRVWGSRWRGTGHRDQQYVVTGLRVPKLSESQKVGRGWWQTVLGDLRWCTGKFVYNAYINKVQPFLHTISMLHSPSQCDHLKIISTSVRSKASCFVSMRLRFRVYWSMHIILMYGLRNFTLGSGKSITHTTYKICIHFHLCEHAVERLTK